MTKKKETLIGETLIPQTETDITQNTAPENEDTNENGNDNNGCQTDTESTEEQDSSADFDHGSHYPDVLPQTGIKTGEQGFPSRGMAFKAGFDDDFPGTEANDDAEAALFIFPDCTHV